MPAASYFHTRNIMKNMSYFQNLKMPPHALPILDRVYRVPARFFHLVNVHSFNMRSTGPTNSIFYFSNMKTFCKCLAVNQLLHFCFIIFRFIFIKLSYKPSLKFRALFLILMVLLQMRLLQ